MNAVAVTGDAVGPTLFYGAGAGELPTASAVVADLIEIAREVRRCSAGRVAPLSYLPGELCPMPLLRYPDQVAAGSPNEYSTSLMVTTPAGRPTISRSALAWEVVQPLAVRAWS